MSVYVIKHPLQLLAVTHGPTSAIFHMVVLRRRVGAWVSPADLRRVSELQFTQADILPLHS